jgi:hypothetical protein
MKDARVVTYRKALESLVESLDATLRLERWPAGEIAPEPLHKSAAELMARLGTAARLASSRFAGAVADVSRVDTMRGAMQRLDAAWVAYRQSAGSSDAGRAEAQSALRAEIEDVTANAI